jgi:hypothetical protein
MFDGTYFLPKAHACRPTLLYGVPPQGAGTGDVESLHSYVLALAHAHALTPNTVVRSVLQTRPQGQETGMNIGWGWDKHRASALVGVGEVPGRFAAALGAATGRTELRLCTLGPLSRHICGQGLVDEDERVCLACLAADLAANRLPYGRLLWRLGAVTCCPIHRRPLVLAKCGGAPRPKAEQFGRRKLAGSCGTCGSIGYRCIAPSNAVATPFEVWRAQQCAEMIVAMPKIDESDPLMMKDMIRAYCSRADGIVHFAERVGAPKSQVSRWLSNPTARFSLAQMLDIAANEGFSLARMLAADLIRTIHPDSDGPMRLRRPTKRLNHYVLECRLKAAVEGDETIQTVASDFKVDASTIARHTALYAVLRDRARERHDGERSNRHQKAVGQAEATLVKLVSTGRTPTLRNAGVLTGEIWHASQLRSIAFTLMRISLGNTRLSRPSKAVNLGSEFTAVVAAAVERVKAGQAIEQPQLLLE